MLGLEYKQGIRVFVNSRDTISRPKSPLLWPANQRPAMNSEDNVLPPVSFPDLDLTITYEDGLRYCAYRLKMFGRGELKPFCEARSLPYTTIVNLKNGNLKTEEIRLVLRLLRNLDVPVELIRIAPDSSIHRFLFPNQELLDTFRAQLKCFDGGVSPLEKSKHEQSKS